MKVPKQRPKYYDLNLLHLPAPGLVSILHRISGVALFLVAIPLALAAFADTLASEAGWRAWREALAHPLAKLLLICLAWFYAHHLLAGIRYLLLDVHVGIAKRPAQSSARVVLVLGLLIALAFAWRIW